MQCAACLHDNDAADKFCSECGAPLIAKCARCSAALKPAAKFCSECGTPTAMSASASSTTPAEQPAERRVADYTPTHLAERIRAEQAALEARGAADGERKTITALFADLKGSTALIEGLDPEEVRAIIDPALQLMMDAVHQYDGYVAQVLGDGIFALFGAPLAHEDHPQRALYAALRMQEAMGRYGDTLRSKGYAPLQMRVGINTGEVVVRSIRKDDLHTDYVPIGHSTNLAARMEQLASPGTIVVSAYTHQMTDGYFAFKDLGPTQVKGVEEPLNIYEVLGVGPLRTRLQRSARRGLTRFVGRQSEMQQLNDALESARAGQGQVVGVMGEPGLGKSRLFYEFKLLSVTGCLVLEAYSVSHGKATAYLPVIELLKVYFDIQSQDDERKRREKVTGKVLNLDRSLEDTLPYLFALLGIEVQPSPLHQMDPSIRRQRTFEALKKLFLRESLNQPLILIFEDLHWIDGETQGFLDALCESVAGAKLLLLANYRPEYRHEWSQKTYYRQLRLAPLGKAEAEELLSFLLGSDASLAPAKQLILAKTQGTPFFMEEVVQTLVEDGTLSGAAGAYRLTRSVSTLQLPSTVQAILAARIDRLAPDEKALLQQLSVIGRAFPASLVRQVIAEPEADLHRLLAALQRKEFLYEQPAFPEVEYVFKHALTQEVAYGTVLQDQRRGLHERTAQAIEALYAGTHEDHYGALAHHYSRSGNTAKAVEYLGLAGEQAARQSANAEAISRFSAALELLSTLPDTTDRARTELRLQLALGPVLQAVKGVGAQEVGDLYARAQTLCKQLDDPAQLFPVLFGLWFFHSVRADYKMAWALAEELLDIAMQSGDAGLLLEAHHAQWPDLLGMGHLSRAQVCAAQGFAYYDQKLHPALASLYGGHDAGNCALSFEALALWLLGYPDQARQRSEMALGIARDIDHAYSLAECLALAGWLRQYCREDRRVVELTQANISHCDEHGFSWMRLLSQVLEGWAMTEQGRVADGIAQLLRTQATLREMGGEKGCSHHLAMLAEAYGKARQAEEGLAAVAEALAFVARTDESFYAAELYRLEGELILQSAREDPHARMAAAETSFRQAIEIARQQEAKSWELRAATSLARLWQSQGKQADARDLLAPVYDWFSEGFDTRDLQDAKTLLEALR